MTILITGAGGNLGRALVPLLLEQGHTPKLMDFRALETPHEFIEGDVRNLAEVQAAAQGADAIVHCAALHGIHLRNWKPEDFWAINATGTFNVYEAARAAGIQRVVLCSTMGVYGRSAAHLPDAWNVVTEELPLFPGDVYGMSKVLCEEMARFYGRSHGITTVSLRLGMFVPEGSLERYGFRLLFGGVDDRDVAQAAFRALSYEPKDNFEAFNIMADVRFGASDARDLQQNTVPTLEKYYPGLTELMESKSWSAPSVLWGRTLWSIENAKTRLGFAPQFNFAEFLDAVRSGKTDYVPVCGTPWWGV